MTEDLIAFCGLYCGDCHGHKGKVADLARSPHVRPFHQGVI